jgi:LysR family glycine cleavage system transcriptional activator
VAGAPLGAIVQSRGALCHRPAVPAARLPNRDQPARLSEPAARGRARPSQAARCLVKSKIDLRKLPPLNALKGFEAAMRRQSVRDAAEELCVTHPAISYQLQLLEADLGVELFTREGRRIVPTRDAEQLYPAVRTALETLIEAAERLRRSRADTPLRVQTYVTPSVRWLARRMPAFSAAHPEINVLLSTCSLEWDFDESLADVGLVYCEAPPDPAFLWLPLFDYTLYAVCAPALCASLGPRPGPADLLAVPLVSMYSAARDWEVWFEAAGVPYTARTPIVVDTLAVALEIALEGRAVALANGPFVEEDLASGRLVRPVAHTVRCPGAWGLICRREKQQDVRVRTFLDWILAAAPPQPAA